MSRDICFAFSIHKAGSTLFFNLLNRAMDRANELGLANALRYVSIPDHLFNTGVPELELIDPAFPQKHDQKVDESRTLYGGFRFVPAFATDDFLAGKRIMVLVRDPRDVLTSLYFSVRKSHRIPVGDAGAVMADYRERVLTEPIDRFVTRTARQGRWLSRYVRLGDLKDHGVSWRYEDVIFDKARWLREILDYLEIDLPAASCEQFVNAEDIRPDQEDADRHIRQVTPGDHRRKLSAETIAELNEIFSVPLRVWGYS